MCIALTIHGCVRHHWRRTESASTKATSTRPKSSATRKLLPTTRHKAILHLRLHLTMLLLLLLMLRQLLMLLDLMKCSLGQHDAYAISTRKLTGENPAISPD